MIDGLESTRFEDINDRRKITKLEGKALHGQHLRQNREVRSEKILAWLQNEDSKREADILLAAA